MLAETNDFSKDKVSIEVAIARAGFGLYSHILTSLAGVIIVSSACIGYGSTILVPTSACELETTASQQGLLAAAPVVGSILGTVVWGYLADTRGRRKMLIVALLSSSTINCLASLSVNWIMLMALQFTASLFGSGLYSMAMSILSESVPLAKRNQVVFIVSSIFLLSQGLMAVLAIPIIPLTYSIYMPALGIYWNSWRTLVLVYSMPAMISAVWIYFMKESPKFVYAKGDEDQALEILRTIHRTNHFRSYEQLQVTSLLQEDAGKVGASKSQVTPLFKPPLLKYTLIMSTLMTFQQIGAFLVWLPTIANQFVRNLQADEGFDQNLCGIIRTSVSTPASPDTVPCALNVTSLLIVLAVGFTKSIINILIGLLINKVGRRNLCIIITSVCGASGILVNLIPNAFGSVAFFVILLMGIIVLGMYTAIIVSLFPTHLRAIALALPLTVGRIGTFASIQILNIMLINSCEAGFYLFSAIFASSALVAAFLPDDRRLTPAPLKPKGVQETVPVGEGKDNVQAYRKNE